MPTRLDTNFARLTDDAEFESLIRDICALEWGDPSTERFGRGGQKQDGVDVYGRPAGLNGVYRGAQCKLRTKGDTLSEAEIRAEVKAARNFRHPLDKLIIATDAPRDTHSQILVDKISEQEFNEHGRKVVIWSWSEITERLAAYPELIVKYYADYFANLTSLPLVEKLVNIPLSVTYVAPLGTAKVAKLRQELRFRGLHLPDQQNFAKRKRGAALNQVLPDGAVFHLSSEAETGEVPAPRLRSFVNRVQTFAQQPERDCPVIVIVPGSRRGDLEQQLEEFEVDLNSLRIFEEETLPDDTAAQILKAVFDYGYDRRGCLPTFNIAVRSTPTRPDAALLDMDWGDQLTINRHPSHREWRELFVPALADVTKFLTALPNKVLIQVESRLPLPAAFALGFFLNIRVARLRVWARRAGVSDLKHQLWLSDGAPAEAVVNPVWVRDHKGDIPTAVLELTSSVSIHQSVSDFVRESQLEPGAWLQVGLVSDDEDVMNIDEARAVAYANGVGRIVRELNALGITDIHLFARLPSALAVLVGQRLQACGRIHLYWFRNPTYQYAFTLQ